MLREYMSKNHSMQMLPTIEPNNTREKQTQDKPDISY